MAAVLVALEAYALIEQVNNIYSSGRERIEHACRNPGRARDLANVFDQLKTKLAPLAKQCEENHVQFADEHVQIFKQYIDDLKTTMKTIQTNLEEKITKLSNPLYRFSRARGVNGWLSSIESTARDADRLILVVTSCFANASLTAKNTIVIESVMDAVGALTITTDDEQDEFRPSFDEVPENPPHVVLNFGSTSDIDQGNHESLTVEAKLKRAVLQSDGLQSVVAVGSRLGVTGVRGMSGVGKSCAMRGLKKDVDVRAHFRDGIYFIVLGKDATERDVIQSIVRIMNASGSQRMAKEAQEGIDDVISKARVWFKGKCMLLEIDDVWEASDKLRDIVGRLSSVADMDAGSRIVFTTRDARMAARSEVIHFGERNEEASRAILLSVAGLQDTDVAGCEGIVDEVLGYCVGIPMALAVAGSAIKMRLIPGSMLSVSDVLKDYVAGLRCFRGRLVKRTVDNDPYANLESAFRASVEMLEKSHEPRLGYRCEMSMLKMYRGLVIIRRQGWIPATVLRGLWNLTDVSQVIDVIQEFVGASLAQHDYRMWNGVMVAGITLHDLQLDFAKGEATGHGEVKMWHRKVLCMWIGEGEGSSSREGVVGSRDWCKDEVFSDEYVRHNVCRHLMDGGLHDEVYGLVRNPEWAAKKLCSGEIVSLEEDIRMVVEFMEGKEENGTEARGVVWCLRMIAGAARLSAAYVSRNGSEVWFQLYGRLFRHAKRSEVMRSYITEIEGCAKGPWLKAVMGGLIEPGGALQSTTFFEGELCYMSEVDGDGNLVVCGKSVSGRSFVCRFVNGQCQSTVWLANDDAPCRDDDDVDIVSSDGAAGSSASESTLPSWRRSSEVRAMCCSRDLSCVATGHSDGRVRIWDAKTGKAVDDALVGHRDEVLCLAWSPDGKRIASGGDEGTVRIWDVERGEAVGETLIGYREWVRCVAWSPDETQIAFGGYDGTVRVWDVERGEAVGEALVGHRHFVLCVAWSPDGKRIVSGGADDTVRVWDVEKGEAVGEALVGHSDWIRCVAWSPDGKRVTSGGDDETVRLWDIDNRDAMGQTLAEHSDWVLCMAWSSDGKRIFSGGRDGTVCVWDTEKGEAVVEVVVGHSDCVLCVEWSDDGKRIASGGGDHTVCLWAVEKGEAVGETLVGHTDWVWCVAWSPDGKRIVSGGRDRTVRLWDAERGEAVGEALVGHTDWVRCVAWSPDGMRIASGGSDGTVRFWDAEKGEAIGDALIGSIGWIICMAWSPDGKRMAAGRNDGMVCIWDVEKGDTVKKVLVGHNGWVECVAWSPDGKRIASGGEDRMACLWEVESGKLLWTEEGWVVGDLSRLKFVSSKEDVSSAVEGEAQMRIFDRVDAVYSFGGSETRLGTIQDLRCCQYLEACRSIAVGGGKGTVSVFRLVE